MKKLLLCLLFFIFTVGIQAQTTVIFLPIIFKDSNPMAATPRLVLTDGTTEIDLLGPNSGWKLADPYWNPQIATYKGGGSMVNAQLAEGQRLVHKEYGNVTETIPLSLSGLDQNKAMQTAHEALELLRQAGDYWAEPYEYDDVWIEAKIACNDCLTGYSRIIKGNIPEITNPFGQPFFSSYDKPVMENISIIFEREPFWRGTKPGEIIGPLYNLIDNPDFELWNFGVTDSQPDSWDDIETTHIVGQNSRDQSLPKFGKNDLKIRVSGSTLAGASKGVTQVINDTDDNTEYTIIAWVRSEGVSNGVGRVLITYSDQLELYRESTSHGWTLYTGKITTLVSDVVAIHCEILTTAANTDGTFYVDGLMFIKGDYETEAINGVLPYLTGSHIVNHWDQPEGSIITAGNLNFVDVHSIPGNVDSLIRLEITNNTTPADGEAVVELINELRVGQRRSNNILKFDNFYDPVGDVDTTASSGNRITISNIAQAWLTVGTFTLSGGDVTLNNAGRYRLFARVRDKAASGDPTLQVRAKYAIGTSGQNLKVLDTVSVPVRDEWAVVDLTPTKSVIWDTKFLTDEPGDLSYEIEVKRSTGTADAHFDYSIGIATDGGIVTATINPSITRDNMLVIDNTASGGIRGTNRIAGAKIAWETTTLDDAFTASITFGNKVYINDFDDNLIYVWNGTSMTSHNFTPSVGVLDFAVYNNRLYASINESPAELWRFISPNSWELVATSPYATSSGGLIVYNGLLYMSDIAGRVFSFDGTTLTEQFQIPGATLATIQFAVYSNRLYLFTDVGLPVASNPIHFYDGVSWQLWGDAGLGGQTVNPTEVFNGKVWIIYGTELYIFERGTLTKDANWDTIGLRGRPVSYNNELFIITGSSSPIVLYKRKDDETFDNVFVLTGNNRTVLNTAFNKSMAILSGSLYVNISSPADNATSILLEYTDTTTWFTVPDYKGSLFTSPPHKRHRWVFSWDRENFINVIDDKALIGIGFVPRYLTLRGKN